VEKSVGNAQNCNDVAHGLARTCGTLWPDHPTKCGFCGTMWRKNGELQVNEVAKLAVFNNLIFRQEKKFLRFSRDKAKISLQLMCYQ